MIALCKKCGAALIDGAVFCHLCGTKQAQSVRRARTKPNGTGTVYKRGKTYTAKVIIGWRENPQGKRTPIQRSKGGFHTRREAELFCSALKSQYERRETKNLLHYWQLYSENAMLKLSDSTQQAYKIAFHKISSLHDIKMDGLSVKMMQDTLNEVAPSFDTAKDVRSMLSNLFQLAMYDGDVSTNKAQALILPENTNREGEPFTTDEITALWQSYANGNKFVGFILLMIYTGMMPIELFKLFMHGQGTIDFEAKTISGIGAKTSKRKETPIVLADAIIPVLEDLTDEGESAMPASESAFYREYYKALESCGCRRLTPYSCRHTTATTLEVYAKATPGVIAEIMRQSQIKTQRRYIHPNLGSALEAVNKIPSSV